MPLGDGHRRGFAVEARLKWLVGCFGMLLGWRRLDLLRFVDEIWVKSYHQSPKTREMIFGE